MDVAYFDKILDIFLSHVSIKLGSQQHTDSWVWGRR